MTFQEIIDQSRRMLNNFEKPYRWQDSELVFFANTAINMMCRDGRLLIDPTTTSTSRITTVAPVGTTYTLDYALSPLVISVLTAHVVVTANTDIRELSKRSFSDLIQYAEWRYDTPSVPTEFCLDYRQGYITLHPAPDAVYTVNLSVLRYPITAFNTTSTFASQTPEIDAAHQYALVDGICYQAFLKPGEDTYDANKSNIHRGLFREAIARMKVEKNQFWGGGYVSGPHGGFI